MSDYLVATTVDSLRAERLLPGPLERVWAYLTDSPLRGQWLAAGEMQLRAGGRVEHIFHNSALTGNDEAPPEKYRDQGCEGSMHGRITVCEPMHLLGYTWGEGLADPSEVRFELTPRGKKVLLVVTHSRLGQRDARLSVAAGWHTHLDILAARLEAREPEGFWRRHTQLEKDYEQRIA
ncbi:uncharacterized protein YndB with AHSA1/START domain [Tahibacter aquaticus]|uniref:Uncharacterized protein YndB with AHSA1/START domain n=1 Tax=Tahibacter aquaticus TaxID=520092 RepID=A0A4R6YY33_9GAMM|nr:SRPBCC family protein [Tahibacter aquaticus]TDR43862.1 uncharacterized protein YndB with AHSA1/START domain [Tahibacter aquaticus]